MSIEAGKQLRAVRTAFGLSQRKLAKRVGVTNGMTAKCRSSRNPTNRKLTPVKTCLRIPVKKVGSSKVNLS